MVPSLLIAACAGSELVGSGRVHMWTSRFIKQSYGLEGTYQETGLDVHCKESEITVRRC